MKREETVDHHVKIAWHAISRMYNQQGLPYEITASMGFVLLNIHVEGTPATKIAPLMGLEARSLTRILKTMEKRGLIYREADKVDKRQVRIFLTQEGSEKKAVAKQVVLTFNDKVRKTISPDRLNVFLEVLQDITKLIETNKIYETQKI